MPSRNESRGLKRRPRASRFTAVRALLLASAGSLSCGRCSGLEATVEGQTFTRCAQASAPPARELRTGSLRLRFEERKLAIEAARPLTIAVFTGPVAEPFAAEDLGRIKSSGAELALWIGGLGETAEVAEENVRRVARTGVPTLFVAGGADRLALIEQAFDALDEVGRDRVFSVSPLREIEVGADRFVVVPGAALGRYSVDEGACGFTREDLDDLQKRIAKRDGRTWLLSWNGPSGTPLAVSFGDRDVGSPELRDFAHTLAASGGLFAFPEVHAGESSEPFWLVAPRLGAAGSLRFDGSYAAPGFASVVLQPDGLRASTLTP